MKKVWLIHRRDRLRASAVYHRALEEQGVEIIWNTRIPPCVGRNA